MIKKSIKKVSMKDAIKEKSFEKKDINLMAIVSEKYPECGEDYALQLWYKTYKNIFAKCTDKSIDEDLETARLVINEKTYIVNIRTASIITL
jgi:hypothetical protein